MAVNIRADVDDVQVDMAIAKLKQAVSLQAQLTGGRVAGRRGGTRGLMREWKQLEKSWAELAAKEPGLLERFGTADLPGINRELRLIVGQIPGMRAVMQYYFRIKRLQRGVGKLTELNTMLPLALSLIATAIVLLQEVQRYQARVERREREYEQLIRGYRGWTHEEFEKNMEMWKLYSRSLPP